MKQFLIIVFVFIMGVGGFYFIHHPDYNQQAIQAIVGEASDQSEATMICIAHAIRNRGTLHGVYGLNARHIWTEPEWVWKKATLAWDISAHEEDVTNGAENFGTASDIAGKDVRVKETCGDFYFY